MPVFDGTTKVGRAVKDPATDKNLPDGKALSYSAMPTTTALAGTTGVNCKLVHGDRWQEILGNMTEHYTLSVTSTIDQNWTITVNGTMNLTVVQGYNEVQEGPVNETYYQVVTINNLDDQYQSIADSFAFTVAMASNTVTIVEQVSVVIGGQLNVVEGVQVNVVGLLCASIVVDFDLEWKTLHAEYHLLHGDGKFMELYNVEAKCKLFGAKSEVGGGEADVKPKVNAAPSVGVGTPLR